MATTNARAYGTPNATSALSPLNIQRREPTPLDVEIDILYCGVCHSDLHQARNEWHNTVFPCVPGHEIVGRVTRVGSQVTKFPGGSSDTALLWLKCSVNFDDPIRDVFDSMRSTSGRFRE